MRFMILLKADEEAEADFIPEERLLAAMAKRNEEAMRAGVMLAGEGLKSSSKGARVKFAGGRPMVTDGPFAEVKELIAGFWVIRVGSKEEAIEWVRNYPYPRRRSNGSGTTPIRVGRRPRWRFARCSSWRTLVSRNDGIDYLTDIFKKDAEAVDPALPCSTCM